MPAYPHWMMMALSSLSPISFQPWHRRCVELLKSTSDVNHSSCVTWRNVHPYLFVRVKKRSWVDSKARTTKQLSNAFLLQVCVLNAESPSNSLCNNLESSGVIGFSTPLRIEAPRGSSGKITNSHLCIIKISSNDPRMTCFL